MNVLSLFDGISCGRVALERARIPVENYYASEIDKWATKVSENNYTDIIRLGDVTKWKDWDIDWRSIDLVLAGSPCQSISNLGDGSGLEGKSGLFYVFFNIVNHLKTKNPRVKFLLENVSGNRRSLEEISTLLRVNPLNINSNKFSAQNRKRLYWTNISVPYLPLKDFHLNLREILEEGVPNDSILTTGRSKWITSEKGQATVAKRYASIDPIKASCLTARSDASWNSNYVTRQGKITKLTPIEYERLQTLPDGYTSCVSNSQRYKMIGNGWTVDVIAHILKGLKEEEA